MKVYIRAHRLTLLVVFIDRSVIAENILNLRHFLLYIDGRQVINFELSIIMTYIYTLWMDVWTNERTNEWTNERINVRALSLSIPFPLLLSSPRRSSSLLWFFFLFSYTLKVIYLNMCEQSHFRVHYICIYIYNMYMCICMYIYNMYIYVYMRIYIHILFRSRYSLCLTNTILCIKLVFTRWSIYIILIVLFFLFLSLPFH